MDSRRLNNHTVGLVTIKTCMDCTQVLIQIQVWVYLKHVVLIRFTGLTLVSVWVVKLTQTLELEESLLPSVRCM